jgi:hypothetical protein
MERGAVLSDEGVYRYSLTRWWSDAGVVRWVMLNPSTADAELDDPTIRRCIGFARSWGYGAINVVNLYGLRATDPRELARHPDPVGPENDLYLRGRDQLSLRELVVCAWGAHPMAARRAPDALRLLDEAGETPHVLGLTKDNQPRHPLYVPGRTEPAPWVRSS